VNLSSGAIRYLVADALGSVRGVVSSTGGLSATTSYDAWGNPETSGGLSSYTPFGFAGAYTDSSNLIYLIHRYYDPTTGSFLRVDPYVGATEQPYAYAGNDPVNATDPTGNSTEGYCVSLTVGIAGANFAGTACIVEANGNQQVGWTFTVSSEVGISTNAVMQYLQDNPLNFKSLFGGSLNLIYQASNANTINQLCGWFSTNGGSGSFGGVSASYQHFSSGGGVVGNEFGIGFSFGVGGVNAGPGLEDTLIANTVSGNAASTLAAIITGLNGANPLHWLASPLNLYSNSV